jgi:hypothetical protein
MLDTGPPGQFADTDRKWLGDWAVGGNAELEKDAGEDGGAIRNRFTAPFWLELPPDGIAFPWLVNVLAYVLLGQYALHPSASRNMTSQRDRHPYTLLLRIKNM